MWVGAVEGRGGAAEGCGERAEDGGEVGAEEGFGCGDGGADLVWS